MSMSAEEFIEMQKRGIFDLIEKESNGKNFTYFNLMNLFVKKFKEYNKLRDEEIYMILYNGSNRERWDEELTNKYKETTSKIKKEYEILDGLIRLFETQSESEKP